MIKLTPGRLYSNKTLLYLAPILSSFGSEFLTQWNLIRNSVLAFARQDYLYNDAKGVQHTDTVLFVVIDRYGAYNKTKGVYYNLKKAQECLTSFLSYFKGHGSYVDDYIFDAVRKPSKHVIGIYLGDKWKNAYREHGLGNFDKMYSESELKQCHILDFVPPDRQRRNPIYDVLTKHPAHLNAFRKKLETVFNLSDGTLDSKDDFDQYDLPMVMENETLNFRKIGV